MYSDVRVKYLIGVNRWLRRATCRVLVGGLSCALIAPSVAAQAPPAAPTERASTPAEAQRREAEERAERGVALAKSGAFEQALTEFRASLALVRTRNALTNSALALRDLRRFVEARAVLREMLSEFEATVPANERAAVERVIGALEANIGHIQVDSVPVGATVIIDGQQRGVTPMDQAVAVDAGPHSLRVTKEGFAAVEASVSVDGRRRSELRVALLTQRESGTLRVREAAGRTLDVVVDGAVLGKTPFEGAVAPGHHSVLLVGEGNLGTAPSAVAVRVNDTTQIVLSAAVLDAEVRIEPSPSNASVALDGVDVGHGVWQGRLTSGAHRLELQAEGHRPWVSQFSAVSGRRELLKPVLTRASEFPSDALASARVYAELSAGLGWSPGFHGDPDVSCGKQVEVASGESQRGCVKLGAPVGFLLAGRGGYLLTPRIGVELTLGYIWLKQTLRRRISAAHDLGEERLYSQDFRDETVAAAPLGAVSVAYRFPWKAPLTLRVLVGLSRMSVYGSNRGTFQSPEGATNPVPATVLSIPEQTQHLWVPFAGPEVRIGLPLSRQWSLDLGVAALLFFGADTPRTARSGFSALSQQRGERRAPIPDEDGSGNLGVASLPREDALGTFLVLSPSLSARLQFQ